jgi:hypothetical protein
VATLRFVEPEEPEMEEVEEAEEDVEGVDIDTTIDVEDIMGEEIKADPNVDYRERDEQEIGFTASQLDLF